MKRLKITTKNFKETVFLLVGNEYSVTGEYVNSGTKIAMRHNKCGNEWLVTPNNFLRGSRCPVECNNIKKTTEQFKQEIYKIVGSEYEVLSQYKGNKKKIKMKHCICGHEYDVCPIDFIMGSRCPKCKWNVKKTTDTFKKEIFNLTGNEYEVLGEYKGANIGIMVKHTVCGHKWLVKPSNFLFGSRCPICSMKIAWSKHKKTHEQFTQEVNNLAGDEYEVIGKYENSLAKIKIKHNKCGTEYMVKPNDFLSGYRCPHCCGSHGEKAISKYLRKSGIKYRSQYKINECRNVHPLPFDFAIFKDDKLSALIEYDGIQHFKPVSYFGGAKTFDYTKQNDEIKNKYCLSKGIPLIRVPFMEDDIEKYLNGKLLSIKRGTDI